MKRLLATILFPALAIMLVGVQPSLAQIHTWEAGPMKLCLVQGSGDLGLTVPPYFTAEQCRARASALVKDGKGELACINPPDGHLTVEGDSNWNTCGWDVPESKKKAY